MKTTHTALLCVLALAIGLTSGCGKSKNEASNAAPKQTQDEQGMAEAARVYVCFCCSRNA